MVHDHRPSVTEALRIPRHPLGAVSLFWPVFLTNAVLLAAATVTLALSPATVSFPVTHHQAMMLTLGVAGLVAANAVVIHHAVRPLRRFAALMSRVDLLRPGQRLDPEGSSEIRAVADAFNAMLERLESERRASSRHAVGSQEKERRAVARELHDEVGQGLTALLLRLKETIDAAPPELRPQLQEMQALAREKLETVRRLARDLRPAVLDNLGIAYALHMLLDFVEDNGGPRCARRIAVDVPRRSPEVELAFYRVAQEALTNVVRHAGAESVTLEFREEEDGKLLLAVEDDGLGIAEGDQLGDGGMQGMRERALAIGGRLLIRSTPYSGTRVTLTAAAGR